VGAASSRSCGALYTLDLLVAATMQVAHFHHNVEAVLASSQYQVFLRHMDLDQHNGRVLILTSMEARHNDHLLCVHCFPYYF
jgi:hypothetical protein